MAKQFDDMLKSFTRLLNAKRENGLTIYINHSRQLLSVPFRALKSLKAQRFSSHCKVAMAHWVATLKRHILPSCRMDTPADVARGERLPHERPITPYVDYVLDCRNYVSLSRDFRKGRAAQSTLTQKQVWPSC